MGRSTTPTVIVAAVAVFLAFTCIFSVALMIWSLETARRASLDGSTGTDASILNLHLQVSLELSLLLVVLGSSAMGSMVHSIMSFTTYVGNGQFKSTWISWYALRLLLGATVGLLLYVVTRAGTATTITSAPNGANVYGAAVIGGLAGVFAKQAADKLEEIFDVIFRTSPGYGDSGRRDGTR